jgi:hypothetical protein
MKMYEIAQGQGYPGTFMDFLAATKTKGVTINNIPRTDPGYRNVFNPEGHVTHQELIPGSPAADKAEQDRIENEAAQVTANQSKFVAQMSNDEFLANIDKALDNNTFWTTGMLGQILSNFGGRDAFFQEKVLERIQGKVALDRLAQAQAASKTGGVFGALQKAELDLLKNSIAALQVGMNEEQMEMGLNEIKAHTLKWEGYQEMWDVDGFSEKDGKRGSFGELTDKGVEVFDRDGKIMGYYN